MKNGTKGKVRPRRRGLLLSMIFVLLAMLGATWYYYEGQPVSDVQEYVVDEGLVSDFIEDTAEVVSRYARDVSSELNGKLTQVNVMLGDSVKVGQVLFMVEVEHLTYELKGLKARREGLLAYAAELGKPVDEDLIGKLEANKQSALLSLEHLEKQLKTQLALNESGEAVSQQSIDDLESAIAVSKASYEAMEKDALLIQKGTSKNLIKQAQSDIKALDVQIEQIEKEIKKSAIQSPIDGIIVALPVKEGDLIAVGAVLATVEDTTAESLYLEADLLAEDVQLLTVGNAVEVTDGIGRTSLGAIEKIYPKAFTKISDLGVEQKRVTVEIALNGQSLSEVAKVDDKKSKADVSVLMLGYTYDIKVISAQDTGTRVPKSAVFKLSGNSHAFKIDQGKAMLVPVEVIFEGVDMLIVTGLNVGDEVIQSPSSSLEEGARVK